VNINVQANKTSRL